MPKEIDESKLNYNKFPGEHVMAVDDVVMVGDKTFHLVYNYREAFSAEKLEQRFSEVLAKYDYIVGDWGFEQLRLKGFFSMSRKKMVGDQKIDHLQDYINEYCNYGTAYFVLKRMRSKDVKSDGPKNSFYAKDNQEQDKGQIFTENETKPARPKRKRTRKPKNPENRQADKQEAKPSNKPKPKGKQAFEIRDKAKSEPNKPAQNRNRKPNKNNKPKTGNEQSPNNGFVIRTRTKD